MNKIAPLSRIVRKFQSLRSRHLAGWMALALAGFANPLSAVSQDLSFPESPIESSVSGSARRPLPSDETGGPGLDARIGFIGLETLGRQDSIVPLELFPYVMGERQIVFADLRGFLSVEGELGANVGMGWRFIEPTETVMFGFNGFYDVDNSRGELFQQASVGWEVRGTQVGAYGNVYLPLGTKDRVMSQSILNPRFDENQILFDVRSRTGTAMSGLDVNVHTYLPGDFAQDHQIKLTGGWYNFRGDDVEDINGVQVQLEGNIHPSFSVMTTFTHDKHFGSLVAVGGHFRFGSKPLPQLSLKGHLRQFVNRNYNVVVAEKNVLETGVSAINPLTGNAYVVQHVGTGTGTENGTQSNPWETVADAQAAGADIVFVKNGTTLTETIQMQENQYLFGEGTTAPLRDARYGNFNLPGGNPSATTRPVILGSHGDAITLANNSTVAGFLIKDTDGRGVVADGVKDFRIADIVIQDALDDGMYFSNVINGSVSNIVINGTTGSGVKIVDVDDVLNLRNILVENAAQYGVNIEGGHGYIHFHNQLVVSDSGLAAVRVADLETLVVVDDRGTASVSDDIQTKKIGSIGIDQLIVRNTTGGQGLLLENNDGDVGIGVFDVETEGAEAIYARDSDGLIIKNGNITTKNATAVDVEDTDVNIKLTSINSAGGDHAVRFIDSQGLFAVYGSGSMASGGVIEGTDQAIYMEGGPSAWFQTVDFKNNGSLAYVNNAESLIIAGSNIIGTTNNFIDATNLTMLQMYSNQFTTNAVADGFGISFKADKAGSFSASVGDNKVDGVSGKFFKAESLAGGETASLTYAFQANQIRLTGSGSTAAEVNWKGSTDSYFVQNTITGTDFGQTAFRYVSGNTGSQSQIRFIQNVINFNGESGVGIDVDVSSTSTIHVTSNNINFNQKNGTGIRGNLRKASGINISSNNIVDKVGGATGVLFENVDHLSTIVMNANTIDLSFSSAFVDRGIVLNNVLNSTGATNPFVTFSSSQSNTVKGANHTYQLPATGVRGTLLINGQSVQ